MSEEVSPLTVRRPRFWPHSVADLTLLPRRGWLIKKVLREKCLGVLYGPSGVGKSFVALDLALAVASGACWQGCKVLQGDVVYVAGEGAEGYVDRLAGWERGAPGRAASKLDSFRLVREPFQLLDGGQVDEFLSALRMAGVRPDPVVIDTLACAFVGGDENAAGDMGLANASARHLQHELGCAVLILHHGTKKAKAEAGTERGSEALRGAADTMMRLEGNANTGSVTLHCDKQKDGPEFAPLVLYTDQFTLGHDEYGDPITTLAVRPSEGQAVGRRAPVGYVRAALLALLGSPGAMGMNDWRVAVASIGQSIEETKFHRLRKRLIEAGYVRKVKHGTYELTSLGSEAAALLRPASSEAGNQTAATPPPLWGGAQQEPSGSEAAA
jgi:hypothetical protein